MRLGHAVILVLGVVACSSAPDKPTPCTVELLTEQARGGPGDPTDCGSFAPGDDLSDGLACVESNFGQQSAFFVVLNDRVFSHSGTGGEPIIETFCIRSEIRMVGRDAGRLECGDGADGGLVCNLL